MKNLTIYLLALCLLPATLPTIRATQLPTNEKFGGDNLTSHCTVSSNFSNLDTDDNYTQLPPGTTATVQVVSSNSIERLIQEVVKLRQDIKEMEEKHKRDLKELKLSEKKKRAKNLKEVERKTLQAKIDNQPTCLVKGISSTVTTLIGGGMIYGASTTAVKATVVKGTTTYTATGGGIALGVGGTLLIGAGVTLGALAIKGHIENKQEGEALKKQINELKDEDFMSASESEGEDKES